MTDNNTRTANETADTDKGENIVHINTASKNGAEELEKIKRSLRTKKSWATRIMKQLDSRAEAFKVSAAKDATEKTLATKIHLKKKAKDVLEHESQLTLFKAGGGGIRPDLYFFDRSTLKDCKKWGSWGM